MLWLEIRMLRKLNKVQHKLCNYIILHQRCCYYIQSDITSLLTLVSVVALLQTLDSGVRQETCPTLRLWPTTQQEDCIVKHSFCLIKTLETKNIDCYQKNISHK